MLKELFGAPWWVVVGLGVYGLCWGVFHDLYDKPVSRRKWIKLLRNHHWLRAYRRELGAILDWIDRRLSPEVDGKEKPEGWGWKPDQARTAWSAGLLQFSLLLALAYPVMTFLIQWSTTGQPGRIGSYVIVPESVPWWQRVALVPSWVYLFWASFNFLKPPSADYRTTWQAFVAGVNYAAAIFSVFAASFFAAIETTESTAAAFAGAAAFTTAGVAAFIAVFFGAAGFTVAFACTISAAMAIAAAIGGAFPPQAAMSVPMAFVAAFVVAAAIAMTAMTHDRRSAERYSNRTWIWLSLLFASLAGVLIVISFGDPKQSVITESVAVILFLAVMPMANALADFASSGTTRYLLRRGLDERRRIWSSLAWDVALGPVYALMLIAGLIAIAVFVRFPEGTPLIDLPGLFADIRQAPHSYWWLYIGLFSTLLPTLAHLVFASAGGFLQAWPALRRFIVSGLSAAERGDVTKGRWAVQALCLAMTFTVMAPFVIVGFMIEALPFIGTALLEMAGDWAELLLGWRGPGLPPISPAPPGSEPF